MSDAQRTEIRLELDPDGDSISGLLHDGRGETHDFHGWVQLIAAVEAVRTGDSRRGGGSDGESRAKERSAR